MNFADTNWLEALYFESPEAEEWRRFLADFNRLIYLNPMNWDFVRRDAFELFAR